LELGKFYGQEINNVGGLDLDIKVIRNDLFLFIMVYGRKIVISSESGICDDENYINHIAAHNVSEHGSVFRKLPAGMVGKCAELQIFPEYNYISPVLLMPWCVERDISHDIWCRYTDSEKQLMISAGNRSEEPEKLKGWMSVWIYEIVKLINFFLETNDQDCDE
jgi:hypothetical protein